MTEIFLGLGSNVNPAAHIAAGLTALDALLQDLRVSPVFECESVGYQGAVFLNLVVSGHTQLSLDGLTSELKRIERENGRQPDGKKFSPRTLDIDILLYGDLVGQFGRVTLPREEILENAFVLWPLSLLVPDKRHPSAGLSYEALWQQYSTPQKLHPVPFIWQGEDVSRHPLLA